MPDEDGQISICYLIHSLSPAGAERLLLELVSRLPDKYEVTVCYLGGDDTLCDEFNQQGARVVSFNEQFPYDPRMIARALRFYMLNDFDIIHNHLPKAHAFGRFFGYISGVDVIVSTHHSVQSNYGTVSGTLERLTRPLDDKTTAVSHGVKSSFDVDSSNSWQVIHNGIDVEGFAKRVQQAETASLYDEFEIGEGPTFLSVGRYTPEKSQRDSIKAFSQLIQKYPNSTLFIVGWGKEKDNLSAVANQLDVSSQVHITGYRSDVEKFYACADVFLHPSKKEAFGLVVIEAMASKIPVVATDIPGVSEVVDDGKTGVLIPPESPELMAKEVASILEGKSNYATEAYIQATNRFSINYTVSEYVEMYTNLLTIES